MAKQEEKKAESSVKKITAKATEKKVEKKKLYKVKAEKELGFKKRNYYINGKNHLIEAGKEVDEDVVKAFTKEAQQRFFVL